MPSISYWISPKGEIVEVQTRHIKEIIAYPEKFGLKKEIINFFYDKYNEKIGQEGKAREHIMKILFKKGWIRIRKYGNFWSVNTDDLDKKKSSYISQWAEKMLKGFHGFKEDDPYIPVIIDLEKGKKKTEISELVEENKLTIYTLIEKIKTENLPNLPLYEEFKMKTSKKFKEYLNELSLSRILMHIKSDGNFGVISPYRKENTDKENEENYEELAKTIRSMGYGYIPLKGGYKGDEGFFAEKSLFIPNISRNEIIELGKKYNQHSVIHKNGENFALIGTNKSAGIGKIFDKFETSGKSISIDDIGNKFEDFFSKLLKGSHSKKKFLFKMQEKQETSMYYNKKYGDKWIIIYEE